MLGNFCALCTIHLVNLPPFQLYHLTLGCRSGWKSHNGSCYKRAAYESQVDTFDYGTGVNVCKDLNKNSYPAVVSNVGEGQFLYREYVMTTVDIGKQYGGRSGLYFSTVLTPVRIPGSIPGQFTF